MRRTPRIWQLQAVRANAERGYSRFLDVSLTTLTRLFGVRPSERGAVCSMPIEATCSAPPIAAVCATMLRIIVTRLLIVFTLLANLGWVTDTYVVDSTVETATLTTAAGDHQDDCPPGVNCHHCCHASAHLLTIPGSGLALHSSTGQRLNLAVDSSLSSFIPAPPYQPPRV